MVGDTFNELSKELPHRRCNVARHMKMWTDERKRLPDSFLSRAKKWQAFARMEVSIADTVSWASKK
jgi:hypothetical protein